MVSNSALRAGQKVVCVNNGTIQPSGVAAPELGLREVYTVKTVRHHAGGWVGVWLVEVETPGHWFGYLSSRFRPVVTKTQEQDTETFRKILDELPPTEKLDRLAELLNQ